MVLDWFNRKDNRFLVAFGSVPTRVVHELLRLADGRLSIQVTQEELQKESAAAECPFQEHSGNWNERES